MRPHPDLGARIQRARRELRLSVAELASKVVSTHRLAGDASPRPVSPFTIRAYEQGRFHPSPDIVEQLMRALDKPGAYFYELPVEAPSAQEDLRAELARVRQELGELRLRYHELAAAVERMKLRGL